MYLSFHHHQRRHRRRSILHHIHMHQLRRLMYRHHRGDYIQRMLPLYHPQQHYSSININI